MIGQTVSHYRVLDRLGAGGMGVVYLAEDTLLRRQVAIKFPSAEETGDDAGRFLSEARHASQLNHPNIARVYDFGRTADGRPFIVMERLQGQTVDDLMKHGPMDWRKSLTIAEGLLAALSEAHANGILHRDVKPGNIMLTDRGEVKVLDFGLAKRVYSSSAVTASGVTASISATFPGTFVGTPAYMSPEQARNEPLDHRTDVFAAGVVLYELLTGSAVFVGSGPLDVIGKVMHYEPPPVSKVLDGLPVQLDRIVARAMAKNRAARFASAEEFRTALAALTRSGEPVPPPARVLDPRRRAILFAGPVAVLGVAAAAWWRGRSHIPSAEVVRFYDEGVAALRAGTYGRAIRALEHAVKMDPAYRMARARLIEAWMETEYTTRAQSELISLLGNRGRGEEARYLEALRLTLARDFRAAEKTFREIAGAAAGLQRSGALVDLGRAYERGDEPKKALEAYRAALKIDESQPAGWLRSGSVLARLRNPAEAEAAFRKAADLNRALSNVEGIAQVELQRAQTAISLNRLNEAPAALNRALELARTTSSAYLTVTAMLARSELLNLSGQTADGDRAATEAIALAREQGFGNLAARGLIARGNAALLRADYTTAEPLFREAVEHCRVQGLERREATARFSLGSSRVQQGRPDDAVPELRQALDFFSKHSYSREAGQTRLLLARAQRLKGDVIGALRVIEEQVKLARASGDLAQTALAREMMAATLRQLERFPQALEAYSEVLAINRTLSARVGMGYASLNCGKVLWRMNRYNEAAGRLAEASTYTGAGGTGLAGLTLSILQARAEMELSRRRWAAATAAATEALQSPGGKEPSSTREARMVILLTASAHGRATPCVEPARLIVAEVQAAGDVWSAAVFSFDFAEILLRARQFDQAAGQAQFALATAEKLGGGELAWRSAALSARIFRLKIDAAGAASAAARARELLDAYRTQWPADAFATYLQRPDNVEALRAL